MLISATFGGHVTMATPPFQNIYKVSWPNGRTVVGNIPVIFEVRISRILNILELLAFNATAV